MKEFSTVDACKPNCFDFWNLCKHLQNFVNVEAISCCVGPDPGPAGQKSCCWLTAEEKPI